MRNIDLSSQLVQHRILLRYYYGVEPFDYTAYVSNADYADYFAGFVMKYKRTDPKFKTASDTMLSFLQWNAGLMARPEKLIGMDEGFYEYVRAKNQDNAKLAWERKHGRN